MSVSQIATYESADGLELAFADYGAADAECVVICLPGLTRNSRDYVPLARHLADRFRVLTPDLRGRGHSSWDQNYLNYHPHTYANDVMRLIELVAARHLILIGTSLGGLVAALLANAGIGTLRGVVLNDIGPEIDPAGIARIAGYVGSTGPFFDWSAAIDVVRRNNEFALPNLSDARWRDVTLALCRERDDGQIEFDYDPAIGQAFREGAGGAIDLWQVFGALAGIPTLLLRGVHSDILSRITVEGMCRQLPRLQVVEVPERGHAPLLDEPVALRAIDRFVASIATS